MTRLLVIASRFDPQKRMLAGVVVWILIGAAGFAFSAKPKLTQLKKISMDISVKQKQLELEKSKGQELARMQEEVQKLRLEKEKKEQVFKRVEDSVGSKAPAGTPYLVSFFSNLAQFAKQGGAKFVYIRPVDAVPSADEKERAPITAGQKSVDVLLIGKYSVLSSVLHNLERMGVLTAVRQFHVKPSEKGYPLLELQMRLEVILG